MLSTSGGRSSGMSNVRSPKVTLILIDDINLDFGHDAHGALLRYLAESDSYLAITLPVSDGIQACVRLT
ncbi:hypothetical protein [Mycolicibacterium lutetiense]